MNQIKNMHIYPHTDWAANHLKCWREDREDSNRSEWMGHRRQRHRFLAPVSLQKDMSSCSLLKKYHGTPALLLSSIRMCG